MLMTLDDEEQQKVRDEIFDKIFLYLESAVMDFNGAVGILMQNQLKASQVCTVVPQECPGRGATFVIDMTRLKDPRDIHVDSYGSWGKSSGGMAFYGRSKLSRDSMERMDRGSNRGKAIGPFSICIRRNYYRHPCTKGRFRKAIFTAEDAQGNPWIWGIVSYSWDCEPFEFQLKSHGNATRNPGPFYPTKPSTKRRIKELCRQMPPSKVAEIVLNEDNNSNWLPPQRILNRVRNIQGYIPLPMEKLQELQRRPRRKPTDYFCNHCAVGFVRRGAFQSHMRTNHHSTVHQDIFEEEVDGEDNEELLSEVGRAESEMDGAFISQEGNGDELAALKARFHAQLEELSFIGHSCNDTETLEEVTDRLRSAISFFAGMGK